MSSAPNRSESIAVQLRDEILRGHYKPGDRLPAERDLATLLGVNRGSVREALKKLEQLGLVVIRRGDGTTVRHLHEASVEVIRHLLHVDGRLNRPLLRQLLDVHEMLLTGATYLAVERGSLGTRDRARALLRELATASEPAQIHRLVGALIDVITEASGDLVLRLFRNTLRGALADTLATALPRLDPDRLAMGDAARKVGEALEAGDAVGTSEAVRTLIRQRTRWLLDAL